MQPFRLLVFAAVFIVSNAASAQTVTFEKYYPHRVGQTLVFDYLSTAEGATEWKYEGKLIRIPSAPETLDGTTYQTVTHTTRQLPNFFPARWKTYHRETEEGLYTSQRNAEGELEEHLEFPAHAVAGEPWPAQSPFWESETPFIVPRWENAAGTFQNCIRVDRIRQDRASSQTLRNTTTYCPGVGAVHSTVEHVFQEFGSITELTLIKIRP